MRFDKWFLRAARQLGRLAAAWGLLAQERESCAQFPKNKIL